jgi:hypothetical protein
VLLFECDLAAAGPTRRDHSCLQRRLQQLLLSSLLRDLFAQRTVSRVLKAFEWRTCYPSICAARFPSVFVHLCCAAAQLRAAFHIESASRTQRCVFSYKNSLRVEVVFHYCSKGPIDNKCPDGCGSRQRGCCFTTRVTDWSRWSFRTERAVLERQYQQCAGQFCCPRGSLEVPAPCAAAGL